MRLLHRRKHEPRADLSHLDKQIEETRRENERVRGQWHDILRYAAALTTHESRNHIAESIESIYRGGPA